MVSETDDVMLITSDGMVIRMKTREISRIGRLTKGVRLMRLDDDVTVVSLARTEEEDETEEAEGAEAGELEENTESAEDTTPQADTNDSGEEE